MKAKATLYFPLHQSIYIPITFFKNSSVMCSSSVFFLKEAEKRGVEFHRDSNKHGERLATFGLNDTTQSYFV